MFGVISLSLKNRKISARKYLILAIWSTIRSRLSVDRFLRPQYMYRLTLRQPRVTKVELNHNYCACVLNKNRARLANDIAHGWCLLGAETVLRRELNASHRWKIPLKRTNTVPKERSCTIYHHLLLHICENIRSITFWHCDLVRISICICHHSSTNAYYNATHVCFSNAVWSEIYIGQLNSK